MQNDNWYTQWPKVVSPYSNNFTEEQNPYGYFYPMYNGFYRFQEEDEGADSLFATVDTEQTSDELDRAPQDVNRVMRIIYRSAAREIAEIIRAGMDRRLLDYLIRSMVTFIDRNYDRYRGTLQQKVQAATRDIRRELYWIFDIMRIFGISPATQARLTNSVVTISFQNLRTAPPPPTPR
jgi:hypothetical protein